MVFENVTLFELHLENSRFSAPRGGTDEDTESDEAESFESESEESGGSGRSVGRMLALVLFLTIAGVAVRRYRSGDDDGGGVGSVDEAEGVTIEQAAEQ